jgi:alpha-glucosidase
VGDDNALATMAAYTTGSDKLHMAYSFNLLTAEFSAAHIRTQVEEFEAKVTDGWASWSVGNHDSVRVMTRWGGENPSPSLAKVVLAVQAALKGTPCLYQGDELALTEADIPFEALQDPYGIPFWPQFKGRDGCRTPMPWVAEAPHGGFSTTTPWLPVPPEHLARAVDVAEHDSASALGFVQNILAWRRTQPQLLNGDIVFFDAPEPVLALRRDLPGQPSVLAAFNLGTEAVTFAWPDAAQAAVLAGHGLAGSKEGQQLSLPPHGGWFGTAA